MQYPKISIVTPSFNQGQYLEETILSVLNQQYPNLEYIIIDGGSTDNSVEIIKKYGVNLTWWISEKDNGMYEAIQKGFKRSTGEIMGWINSDDFLHPGSLFYLAKLFTSHPHVNWIQGVNSIADKDGIVENVFFHPSSSTKFYYYSYRYLADSGKALRDLGCIIQQESTYWRRSLWEKAGGAVDTSMKYAGDFELWMRFFRNEKLYNAKGLIGCFRINTSNQISHKFLQQYIEETKRIVNREVGASSPEDLRRLKKIQFYNKYILKLPFVANLKVVKRFFCLDLLKPVYI